MFEDDMFNLRLPSIMGDILCSASKRPYCTTNDLSYEAWEEDNTLHMLIEVPGMTAKVSVNGSILTVDASREKPISDERISIHQGLSLSRKLVLDVGDDYDTGKIEAHDRKNGLLEIIIHKAEQAGTQVIEIK